MYSSNHICKYLSAITLCVFFAMSSIAYGANFDFSKDNKTSIQAAEKVASKAYKKYTKNKIKKFTCLLITENQETWAFGCEEITNTPRPGGVLFVNIDKISGKPTIYPGK